jgi:hypothetical protein
MPSDDKLEQGAFFEEIKKILALAEQEHATLRALGATAIRIHSETARGMAANRPLTDLDFVAYRKDRRKIEVIFSRLGYQPNQTFNRLHGDERLLFFGRESKLKVDVWLEVFRMAHTFNFKNRLQLDCPTLPLSDLLITKLQIVELNEKDVRDMICLLVDHPLSQSDENREMINVSRLVDECCDDWGVYKTFTTNLNNLKELASHYLNDSNLVQLVTEKVTQILNSIETAPKSFRWKMRAKIGEKKSWYESPDVR